MNSRRRVTAALIALLALVFGVWLARHTLSAGPVSGDTSYGDSSFATHARWYAYPG